jgi:cytochrome c oxidase subunit 2
VLISYNWSFRPREIRIPAGSEVTFRLRSDEDYHGIAIIGTPIVMSFEQNEIKEVTHIFEEPGEYPFVCTEYCGAGHASMAGMVIVE